MKKRDLIRKNMVESVTNERNILAMANNPFVVRFYYSFTSKENLYIVMEYLSGGDCYRWVYGTHRHTHTHTHTHTNVNARGSKAFVPGFRP